MKTTIKGITSRQIAKQTGKEHCRVISDIEEMLKDLREDLSRFQGSFVDSKGKEQKEYNLNGKLALFLQAIYQSN